MVLLRIDLKRLVQALVRYNHYLQDREDIISQCTSRIVYNGIDDIHSTALKVDKACILLADSHKLIKHDEIIAKHYKANIQRFGASEQHTIYYYFSHYLELFELTPFSYKALDEHIAEVFKGIRIEVPERSADEDLSLDNSILVQELKTMTLDDLEDINLEGLDSNVRRRINNRITLLQKQRSQIARKQAVERLKQSDEYLTLERAYKGLEPKIRLFCDEYAYNLYCGKDEFIACSFAYFEVFDVIDNSQARKLLNDEAVKQGIAYSQHNINNADYIRTGKIMYDNLAPSLIS